VVNWVLMKKTFPFHGFIGIVLLIVSEILHFKKVDPFYSWFYCFAWWSYILTIDGIIYRLKRNSLILNRTKEFFLMIPWSIFIWLIFEAVNVSLNNWYYIDLPHPVVERWLGYAVAYGTVLPGLFETTELLEALGLFRNAKARQIVISSPARFGLVLLGILCLLSSVLVPSTFFPLIWVGFIFFLEPINYWLVGRSLLKDVEEGIPRKIYLLLIAGLICGLLWEFWNFWARSKWVYTVPFFEGTKGFEMPYLGFLGFPPFAIQAYVMYNTLSLFRCHRGWEQSSYRLNPKKKTSVTTTVLAAILIVSFSVLVFRTIDLKTVDSYTPRLSDAYWIPPQYRTELPKVGITGLDDLISKTKDRKERDELALRLLIPREELLLWVERAHLVRLKGLGVENLRLLQGVGINSVPALSSEDPSQLQKRMIQNHTGRPVPNLSKLRIWVREAQRSTAATK
jgi:hypothetical protein